MKLSRRNQNVTAIQQAAAAVVEPLEIRRLLSSVVVNTTLDQTDPAGSSTVSLRDALAIANSSSTGQTDITFDSAVFATHQTITLNGTYLSITNGTYATSIVGPAAGVTLDGNNLSSVIFSSGNGGVTLQNLVVTGGNTGGYGGGLNNQYSPMTLIDDTFTGNHSSDVGGGINTGGPLTMTNVTISGNTSSASGGGLWDENDNATLTNVTIVGNSAAVDGGGLNNHGASIVMANSIIAGNSAGDAGPDVAGTITSSGYNLIGQTDGSIGWTRQDLTGTTASPLEARLGNLTDNGGPNETQLPLAGSPAINAGSVSLIPAGVTTDQRGYTRVVNNHVDIGAVESEAIGLPTTTTGPAKTIGGLDPGFGAAGLARHNVGFTSTNGLAIQGANSILIGPIGASPVQAFGVTRYLADGSLDSTFGVNGVADIGFDGLDAVPTSVIILKSGNIFVGGTATTYTDGVASGSEFAVTELSPDGAPDAAFGQLLIHFSTESGVLSNDTMKALAEGPSGVIYAGGTTDGQFKGDTDFAIAAIEPTGGLDTSFFNGGASLNDLTGGDDTLGGLAVQSNGDIVAAGSSVVNGVPQVSVTRLLSDGTFDKKFGARGVVTDGVGGVYDAATRVLVQPKGQIVVGGLTASGSGNAIASDFLLQRFTSSGKLDRTFGNGGTVTTPFDQVAAVTQLQQQADGSIIASGRTSSTPGGSLDVAVARYTAKGTLDTSFNGTGKVLIDLGTGIVPAAATSLGAEFDSFVASQFGTVAITQGGEILAAGNSGADTVEAELIAAGVNLLTKVLSSFPASVLQGAKGKASVNITESGTTAAKGSITITIAFAADAAGNGATGSQNFPEKVNLKQGQSKTFKLNFTFTGNGGSFVIASVTNGDGVPSDLNVADNVAASDAAVAIAPAFVSLAGSNLSASPIVAGKTATFVLTVTNNGNVTAKGKTEIDFFVSSDAVLADGIGLGVAPLGVSLAAGKSKTFTLKAAVAATVTTGTFDLLGVIDPNNNLGSGDSSDSLVVAAAPVVVS